MTFLIAGAFFFAPKKGIGKGMYVFRKMIKKWSIGSAGEGRLAAKENLCSKMSRGDLFNFKQ